MENCENPVSEEDLFITNKCNSNCIMCPVAASVRKRNEPGLLREMFAKIEELPSDVPYINITGGEPTLAGNGFFEVMQRVRDKFQHSGFQLLSNGRTFSDACFVRKMLSCSPSEMRFAIPVHCCIPEIHDAITRVKGSFAQTDAGIKNLLSHHQKVEIRMIVSAYNAPYLTETAAYIARVYSGVYCVNFVGMEMTGNAALNRKDLWIDYSTVFQKSKKAIDLLISAGIDVGIYNIPLCYLERSYWPLAVKSITAYKIRYADDCGLCRVKEVCGGFFASTLSLMKPEVCPVKADDETELF